MMDPNFKQIPEDPLDQSPLTDKLAMLRKQHATGLVVIPTQQGLSVIYWTDQKELHPKVIALNTLTGFLHNAVARCELTKAEIHEAIDQVLK